LASGNYSQKLLFLLSRLFFKSVAIYQACIDFIFLKNNKTEDFKEALNQC